MKSRSMIWSAPALALNEWPHTMPNVIPFPDTRQAEVASERLRTITIELLALIYDAHGRAGFERCAEELIEAVDAVLEHERAKVRDSS